MIVVSVTVGLSVCLTASISQKPDVQTSPSFRRTLPVAAASILLRWRCDKLFTSDFVDEAMLGLGHNGQAWAKQKSRMLKMTRPEVAPGRGEVWRLPLPCLYNCADATAMPPFSCITISEARMIIRARCEHVISSSVESRIPGASIHRLQEKVAYLIFGHSFRRCRPIFKILTLTDSQGNSVCTCYGDFHLTWTTLLHYLVKFQNSKQLQYFYQK